jgi:pimeloyl-ACP methyl ester carboxylesterase
VRTWRRPTEAGDLGRPEVVIILIPGFLGGATTFDPLARDLAFQSNGRISVWAVDRRPNQLEDPLGGNQARDGAQDGDLDAIFEGA